MAENFHDNYDMGTEQIQIVATYILMIFNSCNTKKYLTNLVYYNIMYIIRVRVRASRDFQTICVWTREILEDIRYILQVFKEEK